MLASPRGIEAILGIAAAVHDERVVERADLQRPRRERRLFPHHDSSDDEDAKRKGEDQAQAQHPPDSPSSARRLADGGVAGPNRHASIMAGGYALEESSRRLARATGGFAPAEDSPAAARLRRFPTRLVSPWAGLAHRPSRYRHCRA